MAKAVNIHELRSRSFNKTLNLEDIQRVRSYFNSQKFDVAEINISDRYLRKNARGTISRIDVFCKDCIPKNLMIEFKSGPGSITGTTIREQFIQRDLFNAESLEQIQWRMTNTGMTKEKLVKMLLENREAIKQLGQGKVKQLLSEDKTITVTNFVDKLINEFKNGDSYSKIFR